MAVEFIADTRTEIAVHAARGLADGRETGTDHLLTALVLYSPEVRELLDPFDITPGVAAHMLRQGGTRWASPDGVERSEIEVVAEIPLGPGANAALARCLPPATSHTVPANPALAVGARCDVETLLAAVLHDDRSHAAVMLAECGVKAADVREALRTGQFRHRPDPVAPELRECRDRLLGRQAFKGFKFRAFGIVPIKFNYAPAPLMWARWEAEVVAKRERRRVRTDDVLVAMLGTFEVASAYPHLIGPAPEVFDGTRALVAAGLAHERAAAAAASADLGTDTVRPGRLLANPKREARDTTHLLRMLLQHEDNRSVRLLRHLDVEVAAPQR